MLAAMQGSKTVLQVPQHCRTVAKQCKHALELLQFYGANTVIILQAGRLGNSKP